MHDDNKWPHGTTLLPEANNGMFGNGMPDTHAESHITNTATKRSKPGAAAQNAAQNQVDKSTPGWPALIFSTLLPLRQPAHGLNWQYSWYERLASASSQWQKTTGKWHSCSNVCPWTSRIIITEWSVVATVYTLFLTYNFHACGFVLVGQLIIIIIIIIIMSLIKPRFAQTANALGLCISIKQNYCDRYRMAMPGCEYTCTWWLPSWKWSATANRKGWGKQHWEFLATLSHNSKRFITF